MKITQKLVLVLYISVHPHPAFTQRFFIDFTRKKSRHVDFTSDVKTSTSENYTEICTASISVLQIVLQGRRMPPIGRVEFFN